MEIQPSIVAILARETADTYVGTGFLVGDGIIITCTHVVEKARKKDGTLLIQFELQEPVQAKIIASSPTSEFDVTILRPVSIPAGTKCLLLTFASAGVKHNFETFGYPEISMNIRRLAADGRILAIVRDDKNNDVLQLNSEQLTKGYSGSPIWDKTLNAVVGMVNSGITLNIGLAHHGTTFAIPSETLKKIYPALELVEPVERGAPDSVGRGAPDPRLFQLFTIPAPPENFTGRTDEIADLLAHFNNGVAISGLSGGGGVGKSALARVLVEKLTDQYPDARIQLDLQGAPQGGQTPLTPVDALRRLLQPFHPTSQLPDDEQALKALLTDTLRGKRVLFLLDNARDAAQVRPLLPPAPSAAIITSRTLISLPDRKLYAKAIDRLPLEDARDLLRTAPRLQNADEATLNALATQCGALPLALNVAAALLESRPDWSPTHLIERLANERTRLSLLKMDGDPDLDVEASLSLSYNQLDEEKQRLFRTLGIFPAPFDLPALSHLWDLPPAASDDAIGFFLRLSLLETRPADAMPYRLHDLTRIYAETHLLATPTEWPIAAQRHADYFLQQGWDDNKLYEQGHEHVLVSLRHFDLIWPHLQAAYQRNLQNAGGEMADDWLSKFIGRVAYTLQLRLTPHQHIPLLQSALAAARRLQDRSREAILIGNLGLAYADLGEARLAISYYEQHLEIAREIGDRQSEGADFGNLGIAYRNIGEARRAIEYHEQALDITREIGDRRGEGQYLGNLGNAYKNIGETRRAIEYYEQALNITCEIGDRRGEGGVLGNLGNAYKNLGEMDKALAYYEKGLVIDREVGNVPGETINCWNMGLLFAAQGQFQHAADLMQVRVDFYTAIGHPKAAELAQRLERVRKKVENSE